MTELQDLYQQAKVLAKANLSECCQEIVEWRKSGILCNGTVRDMARKLEAVDEHNSTRLAEQIVVQLALEVVAEQGGQIAVCR